MPDKVAVVTGGSRGIGKAIASRMAAEGFAVAVGYTRQKDAADEVVNDITSAGGQAVAVAGDVGDEAATVQFFDTTERTFGGIDVVAHTAGITYLSKIAEIDFDRLDHLHRTNIRGVFVVAREAVRRVREGGAIINLSTTQVALQFPTYAAYSASKGVIDAMTLVLARELRGRDVTANAVSPGATATELFFEGKTQERIDELAMAAPLQRLGYPDDIAAVVSFLASKAGHWVNGQIIRANGGMI